MNRRSQTTGKSAGTLISHHRRRFNVSGVMRGSRHVRKALTGSVARPAGASALRIPTASSPVRGPARPDGDPRDSFSSTYPPNAPADIAAAIHDDTAPQFVMVLIFVARCDRWPTATPGEAIAHNHRVGRP